MHIVCIFGFGDEDFMPAHRHDWVLLEEGRMRWTSD